MHSEWTKLSGPLPVVSAVKLMCYTLPLQTESVKVTFVGANPRNDRKVSFDEVKKWAFIGKACYNANYRSYFLLYFLSTSPISMHNVEILKTWNNSATIILSAFKYLCHMPWTPRFNGQKIHVLTSWFTCCYKPACAGINLF